MDELVQEPGVTCVFDRGYIDYSVFDRYCLDGILLVTRLKNNTHIEPLQELDIHFTPKILFLNIQFL